MRVKMNDDLMKTTPFSGPPTPLSTRKIHLPRHGASLQNTVLLRFFYRTNVADPALFIPLSSRADIMPKV